MNLIVVCKSIALISNEVEHLFIWVCYLPWHLLFCEILFIFSPISLLIQSSHVCVGVCVKKRRNNSNLLSILGVAKFFSHFLISLCSMTWNRDPISFFSYKNDTSVFSWVVYDFSFDLQCWGFHKLDFHFCETAFGFPLLCHWTICLSVSLLHVCFLFSLSFSIALPFLKDFGSFIIHFIPKVSQFLRNILIDSMVDQYQNK